MNTKTDILQAVRFLAARCDGAYAKDGRGYNGQDTLFGRRLALLDDDSITDEMLSEAREMLQKYVTQLSEAGIDPKTLPEMGGRNVAARQDARRALRGQQGKKTRSVSLEDEALVFRSSYDAALVAAFRDLPGRKWDPRSKTNYVPVSSIGEAHRDFVARWGFTTDDGAETLLSEAGGNKAPPLLRVEKVEDGRVYFVSPAPWDGGIPLEEWRSLPGRKWEGDSNSAPLSDTTLAFASKHGFDGLEKIQEALESRSAEEKALEVQRAQNRASSAASDGQAIEGVRHGLEPYPYQWAGVRHVLAHKRVLVGDEMGVGKTITALISLEAAGAYPAVVVVPEVVRSNWQRETERFVPHRSTEIATGTKPYDTDADIVIIGYTALRSKSGEWADRLAERGVRAVIVDEAHGCKNPKTAQTKAVKRLAEAVKTRENWK